MSKRAVSGIMFFLLLTGMLTLAFNIQPLKAEGPTFSKIGIGKIPAYPNGGIPRIAIGDLDNDGNQDIVSANWRAFNIYVWKNDGSPWDAWSSLSIGSTIEPVLSVDVADFDGDGDLDIVSGESREWAWGPSRVCVWQNDGSPFDGAWSETVVGSRVGYEKALDVGDIDNDGDLDIVSGYGEWSGPIMAWENDGTPWDGSWFFNEISLSGGMELRIADLDSDGWKDVAFITYDMGVRVLRNDGTPWTGMWDEYYIGGDRPGNSYNLDYFTLDIGDLDHDGDIDLVTGAELGYLAVWQNDGTPWDLWTEYLQDLPHIYHLDTMVLAVSVADFDGDGRLDFASILGEALYVWQNDGTPWGLWSKTYLDICPWGNLAIGDLDNDGDADIVSAGEYTGDLIGWKNNAPTTIPLTVSISPTSTFILVGQSVTFTSTVSGGYTPYSYQWYLNGAPVSGATSDTWTFTPTASGIHYVHLKVTDDQGNTAQSDAARIEAAAIPVGGYSIPIQAPATAKPLTTYLILTAILTIALTAIKRKTTKKTKKPP